jgi:hypothetical protein
MSCSSGVGRAALSAGIKAVALVYKMIAIMTP